VAVAGSDEVETPEPNHVSRWERIRSTMWNGLDLLAIPGDQMVAKENMSRSCPYLARQLSVP